MSTGTSRLTEDELTAKQQIAERAQEREANQKETAFTPRSLSPTTTCQSGSGVSPTIFALARA